MRPRGLLVVVGYHLFLNLGTEHTTSGVAALVVALAPRHELVVSLALGLDRVRSTQLVGLAVAFAGVAVVIALGTGSELDVESAKGPLIVLGAPLSFALYNAILKPLLGRHDLLALTAVTSLVGMTASSRSSGGSTAQAVVDAPAADLALLLYLGVLATFLGYIGWKSGCAGSGPRGQSRTRSRSRRSPSSSASSCSTRSRRRGSSSAVRSSSAGSR